MGPAPGVGLDAAQVALTRELFGPSYAAAVATWQESADADLGRLRHAVDAGDLDEAHEAAHGLKGSALSLGASEVAGLALDVEQADALPTHAAIEVLRDAVRRSVTALGRSA